MGQRSPVENEIESSLERLPSCEIRLNDILNQIRIALMQFFNNGWTTLYAVIVHTKRNE
ncbi:MAG: hypothetical protein AW06_002008 [Candidatus Accumulibacter cognatus]|uniref:Uncharacterized protein n=1 Tax=Candidatus Accumulibacter cognatus TaxID=2954383 RepID=A0A080M6K5_9PROT|nr:MAG: hypothetical protein AW06_002008 [Candidatus Accumulibacter cognatus]